MKVILTDLGKASKYDFDPPKRLPDQIVLSSYKACIEVLNDKESFNVAWAKPIELLLGPSARNYMLSGDGPPNLKSRELMSKALYISSWESDVQQFYEHTMDQLLKSKAYKLGGVNQVDLIRDVTNMVHVHFAAELFGLPLETKEHPHGIFSEEELYLAMAAIFTEIFYDVTPEGSFFIDQYAHNACNILKSVVDANVEAVHVTGYASDVVEEWFNREERFPLPHYGVHLIQRLLASGRPIPEVCSEILATAGVLVPNQGQLCAQAIEYYLLGDGKPHIAEIVRLVQKDTPFADEQLKRYLLEGTRINCGVAVFRLAERSVSLADVDGKPVNIQVGNKIFLNLPEALRDPEAFPDPLSVRLDRPMESYLQLGHGPHKCLGFGITLVAMTVVFKAVFALKNVRPVKGLAGTIAKVESPRMPGYYQYLTEAWDMYFPFPCSLKINWDD